MKTSFTVFSVLVLTTWLAGCNDPDEKDTVPGSFYVVQLNPDDIHMYNSGNSQVRLDPFLNDSLKVAASVSYSEPLHGTVTFIPNEGWFYRPHADFHGIDNIVYTVCHSGGCGSSSITMYVDPPLDPVICFYEVFGETVTTRQDQPIAIRIFDNDMICQYQGMSLDRPELGTFSTYAYSGTYKNVVYVYYPPKGFTGKDRFRYRVVTPTGELAAYCEINIE